MDLFITTFTATLGIVLALVTVTVMPAIIMSGVRMVTTRKWQARKVQSLIARGKTETAQFAIGHGFAVEE